MARRSASSGAAPGGRTTSGSMPTKDPAAALAEAVARVARAARKEDLLKPPGIAESLDWTEALLALGARSLSPADLDKAAASLGAFVKYREDQDRVAQRLAEWAAAG